MQAIINKTHKLNGIVVIPGSKSQTIRGLILALLAKGRSTIENFLDCEDTKTTLNVCKLLGSNDKLKTTKIIIQSKGPPLGSIINKINTGNSGITTRFILSVLGLRKNYGDPIVFDCGRQMRQRPMVSLVTALNVLGMQISYLKKEGKCPLLVQGRLLGGNAEVSGDTSQYLSALLLSLPLAPKNSEIRVKNLRERPYVNMTLKWLKDFDIKFSVKRIKKVDVYKIKGGQSYKPFKKVIPGDFSSASCLLAAACLIPGTVVLRGLDVNDTQGDKKLLKILKKMGAELKISKNQILVKGGLKLKSLEINASDIPDLLPALAVIGTQAEGKIKIYNVPQARIKETDRIKSMSEGLGRMKAKTIEHKDGLTIYSGKLNGATVKGFKDHRTVMAMSVAAMLAEGRTVITNAESINKTFPQFYAILKTLGADIKLTI